MDITASVTDLYNSIAGDYARDYFDIKIDLPELDKFISYLPPQATILDAGCGPGNFASYLIGRGFKVTGIDISSEMIRLACGFCPEAIFELMDMQHIKFAGRSFDALISTYSLMHVPSYNLAATINGFARVLKPSGYMFLAFLNGEQKDYFFDEPFNPTKKDFMNLTPLPKVTELVKKIPMSIISTSEINLPKPEFGCQTAGYIIAKKSDEI